MRKIILTSSIMLTLVSCINAQERNNKEGHHKHPPIEKIFEHLDTNEDNKISLEEVKGPLKKDFDKVDLDNDGFITKEELEKAPKPNRKPKNTNQ